MGTIIAYTNQKGGVGKTTTCVNMSTYMAVMGKKVLLLDIDHQGNATTGLGVKKGKDMNSIYKVITGEIEPQEAICKTNVENLDIIPASLDLAALEVEMAYLERKEFVLREILNKLRDSYDFITIDCPPSLGLLTINAFTAADSLLIPIQCEFYALEGLTQLMNSIMIVKKKNLNPKIKVEGVVLTMRDSRSNLGKLVGQDITKFFGNKVYEHSIPKNIRLAEAPSFGMPIYLYDKNCSGAKAYRELTEEFFEKRGDSYTKLKESKK